MIWRGEAMTKGNPTASTELFDEAPDQLKNAVSREPSL